MWESFCICVYVLVCAVLLLNKENKVSSRIAFRHVSVAFGLLPNFPTSKFTFVCGWASRCLLKCLSSYWQRNLHPFTCHMYLSASACETTEVSRFETTQWLLKRELIFEFPCCAHMSYVSWYWKVLWKSSFGCKHTSNFGMLEWARISHTTSLLIGSTPYIFCYILDNQLYICIW